MKLQERISILCRLGEYLSENGATLQKEKARATFQNAWFVPPFIDLSIQNIARFYLQKELLEAWASSYELDDGQGEPLTVGLTMAGNIPLVGFHDWLTLFLSGQRQLIKPSSKDEVLIRHIYDVLTAWEPRVADYMQFADRLNGCQAYIATGSNNSSRYFEYYFGKYPHIIRRNRTSAAILSGKETPQQLNALADDILVYFGLGCRNISKIYVPEGYDFRPLLQALNKYEWMKDHDKFRNNYDYQLSMLILNNRYYMSNGVVLLVENEQLFSPISQVHFEYYQAEPADLNARFGEELQCICGRGSLPFGKAQQPGLTDYADGVDTMAFAKSLFRSVKK